MKNKLLIIGLVIGLVVGSVVGGSLGYSLQKSPLDAAVTTGTPTSANKLTLSTVPMDSPGITGDISVDNGRAFTTAVMENMTNQIAVGIAQAYQDNPNAEVPAVSLIDRFVDRAQAQASCLDVASAAVKNALAYWLPGGTGPCAEITGKYKVEYLVKKIVTSTPGGPYPVGPMFVVKVVLSPDGPITLNWKDPNCVQKTNSLNITPVTRFYGVSFNANTGATILNSFSESRYNALITPRPAVIITTWCSGTIANNGIKIGDVNNCPRCNNPRR